MEIDRFIDHPIKTLAKKLSSDLIFLFDECIVEFDSVKIFKQKIYDLAIEFYTCVLLGFTTYNSKQFECQIYNEETLITQLKLSKSILVKILGCIELTKEEGIQFRNKSVSLSNIQKLMDDYEQLLKNYEI